MNTTPMEDDNTMNFFWGSTGSTPLAPGSRTPHRAPPILDSPIPRSPSFSPAFSASDEHDRFSKVLEEYSPVDSYGNQLIHLAARQAHCHVLLTLKRGKGEDEWMRRERDSWMLVELLFRTSREGGGGDFVGKSYGADFGKFKGNMGRAEGLLGSDAGGQRPRENAGRGFEGKHELGNAKGLEEEEPRDGMKIGREVLTDKEILQAKFMESKTVQLLHRLVRWCHNTRSEFAPVPSQKENSARSVDPLYASAADEDGRAIWELIRSGACYFVHEEEETVLANERLNVLLQNFPWRTASLFGGRPYELSDKLRYGNAHRASWKLACRALASSVGASVMERKVYDAICGGQGHLASPSAEDDDVSDPDTSLWLHLRGLIESWSDFILASHHVQHDQIIPGRSVGEVDSRDEKALLEGQNPFVLGMNAAQIDAAIMKQIKTAFNALQSNARSSPEAKIFIAIQLAMITNSVDDVLASLSRDGHDQVGDGRKLRFLTNMGIFFRYAATSRSANEWIPVVDWTLLRAETLQQVTSEYLDFLLEDGQCPHNVVPYVFALTSSSARLNRYLAILHSMSLVPLSEKQAVLGRVLRFAFASNDSTQLIDAVALASTVEQEPTSNYFIHPCSSECFRLKCSSWPMGSTLGNSAPWCRAWESIERWRWSALLASLNTVDANDQFKVKAKIRALQAANHLIRDSLQSYLFEVNADDENVHAEIQRVVHWKRGEVLVELVNTTSWSSSAFCAMEQVEIQVWSRFLACWKAIAETEVVVSTVDTYRESIGNSIASATSAASRRALLEQRNTSVEDWVSQLRRCSSSLSKRLRGFFAVHLVPLTSAQVVDLRGRCAGRLIEATFDRLESIFNLIEKMRAGACQDLHVECVQLSDVVAGEISLREREPVFVDQVSCALAVVQRATIHLLRETGGNAPLSATTVVSRLIELTRRDSF